MGQNFKSHLSYLGWKVVSFLRVSMRIVCIVYFKDHFHAFDHDNSSKKLVIFWWDSGINSMFCVS